MDSEDSFRPKKCTYCNKEFGVNEDIFEYFPHEGGGYCIFMPRNTVDYSCKECAYKTCEFCKVERNRHSFIECKGCNKTHCFNNTDMTYKNNPFLDKLCDAMNCGSKTKFDS